MIQANCKTCGVPFLTYPSKLKTGRGMYCSLTCRSFQRRLPVIEGVCLFCGKNFVFSYSQVRINYKEGLGAYCSRSCRSRDQLSDPEERFWRQVRKGRGENNCWIWIGHRSKSGYGRFSLLREGKWHSLSSHRYTYEITSGPLVLGELVLHRCDNPPCVRPDHLFLGTQEDNIADKTIKQRQAVGERVATSKLTETKVRLIRSGTQDGFTYTELANTYHVSISTISKICNHQTWKHVR